MSMLNKCDNTRAAADSLQFLNSDKKNKLFIKLWPDWHFDFIQNIHSQNKY